MKYALAVLTVILSSLLGAGQALAADTWLPDFDPNTHVYVDQKMQDRVRLGTDFPALVGQKGAVHSLSVYVVIAEQGDELSGGSRDRWAPDMLHGRLWDRWKYQSGFSEDRILILLYIREKDGNAGSTAVRSGSYLHGLGFDRDHFSSASGPVMPAVKQYMRADPQTGLLTIMDNINAEISKGGVSTSFWTTPWLFGWPAWVWIVIIIIVVIVIICLIARASGGGGSGGDSYIFVGGSSCGGGGGGGCGGGGGD